MPLRQLFCLLLLSSLIFAACSNKKASRDDPTNTATKAGEAYVVPDADGREGLQFTLREAQPPVEDLVRPRTVEGSALDADETEQLLARLPALPASESAQAEFAFRDRSKPAPRTGETVQTAFPPPAGPPPTSDASADAPLEVTRYAPEGDIDLAPRLSVTFSQPMVAVTSQDEAAQHQPLSIEPAVDGRWRWIGTRTAIFEPDGERFPMATDYTVRSVDELESSAGNALQEGVHWSFSTPPVEITRFYPNDQPQSRRPLIFAEFNQRVEPSTLIDHIFVRTGGEEFEVTRATDQQVADDDHVRRLAEQARPGHWLAFRTRDPLPAASTVRVGLRAGTPSFEGPRLTEEASYETFRTFEPLEVTQSSCPEARPCLPGRSFSINFNNPLDTEVFDPSWIQTQPPLEGRQVRASRWGITISGQSRPRTHYMVRIDEKLADEFGQTLDETAVIDMHVGPAQPRLSSPVQFHSILDPAAQGRLPLYSINVDTATLRVHRVVPSDWPKYLDFLQQRRHDDTAKLPGQELVSETIELDGEEDEFATTYVDLGPWLNDEGHGQLIVIIDAETSEVTSHHLRGYNDVLAWVQATDLAVDAATTSEELLAWTSALSDGSPLDDITVALLTGKSATTDASGLARLDLPDSASTPVGGNVLVARRAGDVAILPEFSSPWRTASQWIARERHPQILWHTFDDRGIYKPTETVHLKGWLRRAQPGEDGLEHAGVESVSYSVREPRGNVIADGAASVSDKGGFDIAVDLPDDVNLGRAYITLMAPGVDTSGHIVHGFQIQEFRRPEFEVSTTTRPGPYVVGQTARVSTNARYYAGGGLAGAPVNWTVTSLLGQYTPPGRDDFVFGRSSPWWMPLSSYGGSTTEHLVGHTDATGDHHLEIALEASFPPFPTVLNVSSAVTDVNRQTWSAKESLLVHPAEVYVGLKTERNFVSRGEAFEIDAIVADLDGNLVAERPVEVRAVRLDWRYKDGQYEQVESDEKTCTLSSSDSPERCTFEPDKGGSWRVSATTTDERGRPSMTQMRLWVAGGEQPHRGGGQQDVEIIPDKKTYVAGESAKLLVQAPFADAEALLTVRKDGLVTTERFQIEGTSHTVELPIDESSYPKLYIQVDLVGSQMRRDERGQVVSKAPPRPTFAKGTITLDVPPRRRVLDVQIEAAASETAPGSRTSIDVRVTDADGQPAAASEVAIVAVDEAILALTGYELADPIASFYPPPSAGVSDYYFRNDLLLATLQESLAAAPGGDQQTVTIQTNSAQVMGLSALGSKGAAGFGMVGTGRGGGGSTGRGYGSSVGGGGASPIALREDFRPLALFAPSVVTDDDGRASVDLELPDNLTRYRLMAVAVHGQEHFGKGESTLTARLPVMVRPSPPRFLNWGDRVQMPVVVHNQTDQPRQVRLAVRAANLDFGSPSGRRIEVPAGDRVEVRFPAVTEEAGEATIQVASASGEWTDAAQKAIPVWTPATTEAFATYGTLDDGALAQPIEVPADIVTQFGGLEVTTSSTAVQELTDAVLYLVDYPYECSEQLASRVMGVAALRDVLEAFDAEGLPEPDDLLEAVARDIRKLEQMQRPDGGFYLWSRRDSFRFPYASIHVAHALVRARQKGFEVPDATVDQAQVFLERIEQHIPTHYTKVSKNAVRAYAYYVLGLMGKPALAKTRRLAAAKPGDELSMEAIGWLLTTLSEDKQSKGRRDELLRHLDNHASQTATTAQFTTSYGGQEHVLMHSRRRADAIVLEALMAVRPDGELITKLVRGLLSHRTRGRWLNTQENAFVLLALDRYFATYESHTPDFVARMWLGKNYVGEHGFEGRSTDRKHVDIPMEALADIAGDAPADLALQKQGKGRLYYRIGMRYAPTSLDIEPAEYGFAVERRYEAVDDPSTVTRGDDGAWHIEAGSRVRVVVSMVAPARRYHVALVDPLPAGLEPLNPALAVTEEIPDTQAAQTAGSYWWWFRPWYAHQNLRDERAEAFSPMLRAGVHEYSYVTRATTPGEFIAPAAKAEEMYAPETFGRSGTDRVIVE